MSLKNAKNLLENTFFAYKKIENLFRVMIILNKLSTLFHMVLKKLRKKQLFSIYQQKMSENYGKSIFTKIPAFSDKTDRTGLKFYTSILNGMLTYCEVPKLSSSKYFELRSAKEREVFFGESAWAGPSR